MQSDGTHITLLPFLDVIMASCHHGGCVEVENCSLMVSRSPYFLFWSSGCVWPNRVHHSLVARWATPSKGTQTQSTQLHSHQMEGTLCQVQRIRQSNFGMHKQVARLASPSKGTSARSSQLHSHQMEGTLCQVLWIAQSNFGMHRQVVRWPTPSKGTPP